MLGGSNDKRMCMFCEGKVIKKNIAQPVQYSSYVGGTMALEVHRMEISLFATIHK